LNNKETGRRRASRIPLDYHHGWDIVSRLKWFGAGAAVLATAVYFAWGWSSSRAATRYSHGELAVAHAAWETQCEVCHVPFQPIRSDSAAGIWTALNASDQRCQGCHAGPAHHHRQIAAEVGSCASCHHDHQGRLADLSRVSDQSCLRCHEQIAKHVAQEHVVQAPGAEPTKLANVTVFPGDHPDFRSLKSDPGKLKFTHQRHVARGLISAPPSQTKEQPFTFGAWRKRAGSSDEVPTAPRGDELVELDCAACHRLDESKATAAGHALPRSSGEYMAPIRYEADCRSCHPLRLLPDREDLVPHGLTSQELRGLLVQIFSQEAELENPGVDLRKSLARRPLPNQRLTDEERRALESLAANVARAESHLRTACGLCHEFQTAEAGEMSLLSGLGVDVPSQPVRVEPPRIPTVWLEQARFDHQAHRAMKCLECHPQAQASRAASDVLIDHRKQTCAACHSPAITVRGQPQGGARFDCVECHRYHAADHGAASGADRRGVPPDLRKTLEEFLSPLSSPQ
jgi:hypothetical protein